MDNERKFLNLMIADQISGGLAGGFTLIGVVTAFASINKEASIVVPEIFGSIALAVGIINVCLKMELENAESKVRKDGNQD